MSASILIESLDRFLLHLTNLESELKEIKTCVLQARVENSSTPIDYEDLSPDQESWMDEYELKSSQKDYHHDYKGHPVSTNFNCDHH